MLKSLPDCKYETQPIIIRPTIQTPNTTIYLSNLDDPDFLRVSIEYLFVFRKSLNIQRLKDSLSRVLDEYYPLSGRLRSSGDDRNKLEIECNGKGAVFAEANMDFNADEFVGLANKPNESFRKLLYRVEATDFFDMPPLVIQVTNLQCGGVILCAAINHCLCDGIGASQFLNAWAHMYKSAHLPIIPPFHSRHMLKPRIPPQVTFPHRGFTKITPNSELNPQKGLNIFKFLQSQPLIPLCITFSPSQILHLKRQCYPHLTRVTTFEVLAYHTWHCWVKSLTLPLSHQVKLIFSVNIRNKLSPEMPQGFYGNGFVIACAEAKVKELVTQNLHHGVKLVQEAKSEITNSYVRSMVDLLEDRTMKMDVSASLVISQWSRLGFEELDFGEGKPLHMGRLTSDCFCLFLPVIGDFDAVKVLVSLPESIGEKFEFYMTE